MIKTYGRSLREKEGKAHDIAKELIRRTIFIDLGPGKAKEKNKTNTIRWQFKRIYYPANKVSYGKDDYLDIKNINEFVEFLVRPGVYLGKKIQYLKKKKKMQLELYRLEENFDE